MVSRKKMIATGLLLLSLAGTSAVLTGCGSDEQPQQQMQAAQVKIMKAIKQDTPVTLEYAGTIKGVQEVKVQAKVAGYVVDKYCKGGDVVQAGQPLFRIDSREYESRVLTAQANLAQAQAVYNNSLLDLQRNEKLLESAAIAPQVVDTMRSTVAANQANVEAMMAQVQLAQQNLADCIVYAPIDGKLSVDDVAIGTFAGAGSTPLVTVGSSDPVFVQFSLSENEYLLYNSEDDVTKEGVAGMEVGLKLSNGTEYPIVGHIVEIDRSMGNNTSSLAVKAVFDNPKGVLVPGMFARAKIQGKVNKGAILVPQRAVQQLLGKSFVMTVEDGKSKAINVEIGERIGSYYIVTKGLNGNEDIVVEGLTTLTEGMPVNVTNVTAADMGFSFTDPDGKAV